VLTIVEMAFYFTGGITLEVKGVGCCIETNHKLLTSRCFGENYDTIPMFPLLSSIILLVLYEIIY
jgi:hypothetical protein